MNKLNKPTCSQSIGNTGIPNCGFTPGRIIGAVLTRDGQEFSGEQLVDFIDTLKKAAQGAIKDRVYPIFRFGALTDNSEEATEESLGIGFTKTINDGSYKFTFPLINGNSCYAKQLRKFNGSAWDAFLVCDNGLIGTMTKDGNVRAFTMSEFYVPRPAIATDTTSTRYDIKLNFPNPKEFIENLAFVQTDYSLESELKGILGYRIEQKNATAEKLTIDIVDECSGDSLLKMYGTELSDKTLWTGATAVALEGDVLSLTGTFANGDKLTPPSTQELSEKGIGGYPEFGVEIEPLTIKIPA